MVHEPRTRPAGDDLGLERPQARLGPRHAASINRAPSLEDIRKKVADSVVTLDDDSDAPAQFMPDDLIHHLSRGSGVKHASTPEPHPSLPSDKT
jgi:hypothetical protein